MYILKQQILSFRLYWSIFWFLRIVSYSYETTVQENMDEKCNYHHVWFRSCQYLSAEAPTLWNILLPEIRMAPTPLAFYSGLGPGIFCVWRIPYHGCANHYNFCIYEGNLFIIYFKIAHHLESIAEMGDHINWMKECMCVVWYLYNVIVYYIIC